MTGKKDGLHIRGAKKVGNNAAWELWDGDDRFVGGAYGPMSAYNISLLAYAIEGKYVKSDQNPALDYFLRVEEE